MTSIPNTYSELKEALRKKELTSTEIISHSIEKIKKHSSLNAFISTNEESALKAAKKFDELDQSETHELAGLPIAIKDVILTKDITTTCASKILKDFTPPYSATVTKKLEEVGCISVGKTNMDEFAMGSSNENSAFGESQNPWDTSRVPGGSSGGSAAAVAANLVPASLGTDTGGSVRQPASFTGVVGLKPTYGRNSRYGVIAFASSLDQVGVFANNVKDCALVSEAIAGFDPKDSTSVDKTVDFTSGINKGIKGLKIGIPKEYFIDGLEKEVEDAIKKSLKELESQGAELVEVSLPHTQYAISTYYIIAPAEASSNLSRYDGIRYGHRAEATNDLFELYCKSRAEGFGEEVKRRILLGTYVLSEGYYDAYYKKAQKVRTLIAKDFENCFNDQCDIIACPVTPTTAFKIGENTNDPIKMYLGDIFTIPTSLAGLPGISIPCGFDSKNLPIGLQLIGKAWDESTVLRTAFAYESATEWHTKKPDQF